MSGILARFSIDPGTEREKTVQPIGLVGEALGMGADKGVKLNRRVKHQARQHNAVEWIDPHEFALFPRTQGLQYPVEQPYRRIVTGFTAADQVHGAVKGVAAARERVRTATGNDVALDHEHPLTRPCQQARRHQAADSGADHDDIVSFRS